MRPPTFAATVILSRGPDHDPEVFLARRSPQIRFLGGYWVFPGGKLSRIDYPVDDDELSRALYRCSIREMFEETDILSALLGREFDAGEKRARKSELADNPEKWRDFLSGFSQDFEQLNPVFRITTPPFSPVLYDTLFLHARATDDEIPRIDNQELVDGRFMRPAEAVDAWLRGEMPIAPPVLFLLKLLCVDGLNGFYESAREASDALARGALHPVYFSPGVFMAPLRTDTIPPATTTNTLVVGTEKLYVIDPATPHADEQARLFAKLDSLIADGAEPRAILLTHHHADHVGAVNEVSRRYDLPVRAHQNCYPRIADGYLRGEALVDGEILELGTAPDGSAGWHLRTLYTPGHAVDHLCFIDNRYHSAIVGDMLSTVSTILINPPEGHMRTYLDSLERLQALDIKTLYPAHGPAHRQGAKLIAYYLRHRREREESTIAALEHRPQSLDELLPRVYDDIPESVFPIARRSLLAELIKLEEDGVCRRLDERWQRV